MGEFPYKLKYKFIRLLIILYANMFNKTKYSMKQMVFMMDVSF